MNQPDPRLLLHCPTCRSPLRSLATKLSPETWYLYLCSEHGVFESTAGLRTPPFPNTDELLPSTADGHPVGGSVSHGRILIIDDNDALRPVVRRMLVAAGYDVQDAASGKAGLACLRQQRADGIITDIVMTDMEDLELIRELRLAHSELKIIAVSGSGQASEGYLDLALKLEALQVLATQDSLVAVVNDVLAS
jgi:CheY-like chemotaxis protein